LCLGGSPEPAHIWEHHRGSGCDPGGDGFFQKISSIHGIVSFHFCYDLAFRQLQADSGKHIVPVRSIERNEVFVFQS
jgi:hypothetical protein